MWLINTQTMSLEDTNLMLEMPSYAILSHRWVIGMEVTFADIRSSELWYQTTKAAKIRGAVHQARLDAQQYLWVDTCCINKDSSAELSEAINSMYRWYADSAVCYMYLSDVIALEKNDFDSSAWFTRGWTLQELIAPRNVQFYNQDWRPLGDKISLAQSISQITGVDTAILTHSKGLEDFPVACKMSWASRRKTTRPEDRAYSLMGLFDVNMPLLYGEGQKAFLRLQEEIIRQTNDQSIFAWSMTDMEYSGMLAKSPDYFTEGYGMHFDPSRRITDNDAVFEKAQGMLKPFLMTNKGLHITLQLIPWSADTYLASLDCLWYGLHTRIFLRRLCTGDQYVRVTVDGQSLKFDPLIWRSPDHRECDLFIPQHVNKSDLTIFWKDCLYGFRLSSRVASCITMRRETSFPFAHLKESKIRLAHGRYGVAALLTVQPRDNVLLRIILGFDFDFNPVCIVRNIGEEGNDLREKFWCQHSMEDCFCFCFCKFSDNNRSSFAMSTVWMEKDEAEGYCLNIDRVTGSYFTLKAQPSGNSGPPNRLDGLVIIVIRNTDGSGNLGTWLLDLYYRSKRR